MMTPKLVNNWTKLAVLFLLILGFTSFNFTWSNQLENKFQSGFEGETNSEAGSEPSNGSNSLISDPEELQAHTLDVIDASYLPDPSVTQRKFPFPYDGMLAISSDADLATVDEFEKYHRFLNTKESTPYGEGLGLDIADSTWMYIGDDYGDKADKEGHSVDYSMSYFKGVDPKTLKDSGKIIRYFKAGWIDSLHTFGDFSRKDKRAINNRELSLAAWQAMQESGFLPKVWINHGTETNAQNFGAYNPKGLFRYQEGDDPKSPYYHTDLTLNNGVMFVWSSGGMSQFGYDNPLYPIELRDGKKVWGFYRYTNDLVNGKIVWTWEPHELPRQLTKKRLDDLVQKDQYSIVAQHLGKGAEDFPFNSEDIKALRLLKTYQDEGKVLVARTERLLKYARLQKHVHYTVVKRNEFTLINIKSIDDPVLGSTKPTLEDVRGLTFYTDAPESTRLFLDSKRIAESEIQRNDVDKVSGRKSIGVKWFEPVYTDFTQPME